MVRVNDGDVMRQLAIAGAGLARLSVYHAWHDLAAGRLVPVLEAFNTGELEPIQPSTWAAPTAYRPARAPYWIFCRRTSICAVPSSRCLEPARGWQDGARPTNA